MNPEHLTVGQLRELIAHLEDDAPIFIGTSAEADHQPVTSGESLAGLELRSYWPYGDD